MKIFIPVILFAAIIASGGLLWAHESKPSSGMSSKVAFTPLKMEEIERFHGHLGPNVVMGVRMGEHASSVIGMPRYFGVTAVVECSDGPPDSCLIDGIQVSTGATMGKKNLIHKPADKIRVTIKNDKTGETVDYALKDSTLALLANWRAANVTIEEQSKQLFFLRAEDLFDITKSTAGH